MRWTFGLWLLAVSLMASAADGQALSFDEAVELALQGAPQVTARAEGITAMRELAVSAGRLPDPALLVGVDNLPVDGPDAWSTTADFMTMRNVGLMQEFPNRRKRSLERERASAEVRFADAELADTSLTVARETARAWTRRAAVESALQDLKSLRPEVELGAAAARAGVASGRASTARPSRRRRVRSATSAGATAALTTRKASPPEAMRCRSGKSSRNVWRDAAPCAVARQNPMMWYVGARPGRSSTKICS